LERNLVSVILPVKDEPNLLSTIKNLSTELYLCKGIYEIIVVIGDKNKTSLPSLPSEIKVYKSYGDSLERAILLGFSVAKGKKIIVMDADGSHSPEVVPQLIDELDKYEMVIGSRFVKGSEFKTSPFRRAVTFFFNSYARLLCSTLKDPMSGFFGIRSELLKKIKFRPYTWKIALEINTKLRPKTKEIPIKFKAFTEKGRGKFSNWKIGLRIIWDITVDALS